MSRYVSRITLLIDGKPLKDVKAFSEGAVKHASVVMTMDGQDTFDNTPGYTFNFDYVIPKVNPVRDWKSLLNGTKVQRIYTDGTRTTYTGVKLLDEGEEKTDQQSEVVRTISCAAQDRIFV